MTVLVSMPISVDSPSDETLNQGPLALLLQRQYEFPFGINIVQFSIFNFQSVKSGRGVVSCTCDPVLALGQRFDSHSRHFFCCNPLSKGLTVQYLVFSDGSKLD